MEGSSTEGFKSIRSYWRRRNYQKLSDGIPIPSKKKQLKISRLGGNAPINTSSKNQRSLIKIRPIFRMLNVKFLSPIRLLARVRDAYMDAMLALAGGQARPSSKLHNGATAIAGGCDDRRWEKPMPMARQPSKGGRGDFERRMMLHIYRSIVAPPEVIQS